MIKSLIGTLNTAQVDALIHEEQLKKEGYKFSYAFDADDLRHYAYPLGIFSERSEQKNLSIDYISDEQIALYTLLNKASLSLYVFDEHYEEIKILIDIIKKATLAGVKVINSVEQLIVKLKNETDGDLSLLKSDINLVASNISLLLSIAVGLQEDGINKLHKLVNLEKLILKDVNILEDLFDNSFQDEFNPKSYSELSDIIYTNFLEHRGKLFTDYSNSKSNIGNIDFIELNKRVSFTRDSNVISKVFSINSYLADTDSYKILLYFSSDSKTQDIFYNKSSKYSGLHNVLINSSIDINGRSVNYHRNSAQIFLRLLSADSDTDKTITNLELIKTIVKLKEVRTGLRGTSERLYNPNDKQLEDFLASQLDKCRREFEGYSTFLQINRFNELINSINNKEGNKEDIKLVIDVLFSILKDNKNASNVDSWKMTVIKRINDLSQIHAFRKTVILDSIKNIDQAIFYHLRVSNILSLGIGKDYIFGQDHHLPTYFLEEDENINPKFIEIVVHYDDTEDKLSIYVFELVRKLFALTDNTDELVLKRCLLLLMLSNSKYYGEDTSEYLENFLLKINFKNSYQESNYFYLLIWILRRNGKYDNALYFTDEAIKEYPNDPRFYHSKALCYYCKYEEENESSIEILFQAHESALIAYKFYKSDLENINMTKGTRKFVQLNLYGIMNTIVYLKSLGFSKNCKEFSKIMIEDARKIIEELKKKDESYNKKAEFLHTEAHLELQEYYCFQNYSKLYYSLDALDNAISLPNVHSRLKSLCLKLRDEVMLEISKPNLKL